MNKSNAFKPLNRIYRKLWFWMGRQVCADWDGDILTISVHLASKDVRILGIGRPSIELTGIKKFMVLRYTKKAVVSRDVNISYLLVSFIDIRTDRAIVQDIKRITFIPD